MSPLGGGGQFWSGASCIMWVNEVQGWLLLSLAEGLLLGLAHWVPIFLDSRCCMVGRGHVWRHKNACM